MWVSIFDAAQRRAPAAWKTFWICTINTARCLMFWACFQVFSSRWGRLLVLVWWYTGARSSDSSGRRILSGPPSDLPPGVVGTLLDEKADVQDVLATVIDLARRGFVTMEEIAGSGALDYLFRRVPNADLSRLRPYEKTVLDLVIPNEERQLSTLKYRLYNQMAPIKKQLYQETVKEKLFPRSPDDVRTRWIVAGTLVMWPPSAWD